MGTLPVVVVVDVADRWMCRRLDFEVLKCLAQHPDIPAVLVLNKVFWPHTVIRSVHIYRHSNFHLLYICICIICIIIIIIIIQGYIYSYLAVPYTYQGPEAPEDDF